MTDAKDSPKSNDSGGKSEERPWEFGLQPSKPEDKILDSDAIVTRGLQPSHTPENQSPTPPRPRPPVAPQQRSVTPTENTEKG
jgi:hypothetical protein